MNELFVSVILLFLGGAGTMALRQPSKYQKLFPFLMIAFGLVSLGIFIIDVTYTFGIMAGRNNPETPTDELSPFPVDAQTIHLHIWFVLAILAMLLMLPWIVGDQEKQD